MKSLIASIVILLAIPSFAQETQELPFIEVTGVAEKKIIPNEIYISITVEERESGRDQISVDEQELQLKEAIRELDIPMENLSLSGATSNYIKKGIWSSGVISRTEYILKVKDALEVVRVFEKLDELKIDNARIDRVDHSEMEELKQEVRIMAIHAARNKADYLLEAIGQKRGKALVVKETGNYIPRAANVMALNQIGDEYEFAEFEVDKSKRIAQFTEMVLTSVMYTKFEIE